MNQSVGTFRGDMTLATRTELENNPRKRPSENPDDMDLDASTKPPSTVATEESDDPMLSTMTSDSASAIAKRIEHDPTYRQAVLNKTTTVQASLSTNVYGPQPDDDDDL